MCEIRATRGRNRKFPRSMRVFEDGARGLPELPDVLEMVPIHHGDLALMKIPTEMERGNPEADEKRSRE